MNAIDKNAPFNLRNQALRLNSGAGYDGVAGVDAATLNSAVQQIFNELPGLFTQTFAVNQAGFGNIEVQIQSAPTIAVGASDRFQRKLMSALRDRAIDAKVSEDAVLKAAAMLAQGQLQIDCASVVVTAYNQATPPAGVPVPCALNFDAAAAPGPQGNVAITVSDGAASVPGNPALEGILNTILIPFVLNYINQQILANITIPALSLPGVTLVPPMLQAEQTPAGNSVLVAYTGVNSVQPPSQGEEWPAGQAFVGLDESVIESVVNSVLPAPIGSGSKGPFSYKYNLGLTASIPVTAGASNDIAVTVNVSGSASVNIDLGPLGSITVPGSFSGTVSASANVLIAPTQSSESIVIQVDGNAPSVNINFDISPLPWPFNDLFSALVNALINAAAGLVTPILQGQQFTVYTLPAISMDFTGQPGYALQLQGASVSQIAGPTGLPLLMVQATPTLVPAN